MHYAGAGASPYVMNCNVTIETQDLEIGRRLAADIRATSLGGLPGIQAMAFRHNSCIEIACNVEAISPAVYSMYESKLNSGEQKQTLEMIAFGELCYVSPESITRRVKELASSYNISTQPAYVGGLSPNDVIKLAQEAFNTKNYEFWKTRNPVM